MQNIFSLGKSLFIVIAVLFAPIAFGKIQLDKIQLPPGFKITLFTDEVENPRAMTLGDKGTLFVGSFQAGKIYAITTDPMTGNKMVFTIVKGLQLPTGVAFYKGALYVSAVDRILRFDDIEDKLNAPPKPVIVNASFPKEDHHGWKFIAFGPDGWLYVPVGAPCNICLSKDERFATIMRMKPDGSDLEIFAKGVRNSVGFDWDPTTKELWFTDNGRDWLGDDAPPDELNHAPTKGLHFGYPFCHGADITDPKFGNLKPCRDFVQPALALGPHVAAIGMRFYNGKQFPTPYQGKIFIAEHGSWNRNTPIGYRITIADPNKNATQKYAIFAQGWLTDKGVWGRPADVLVMPDGSLLVSDDTANAIYQIHYQKPL